MTTAPSFDVTIGGNQFTVAPLGAIDTFALQPELLPVLAELVGGLGGVVVDRLEQLERDRAAKEGEPETKRPPPGPDELQQAAGMFDLGDLDVAGLLVKLPAVAIRVCAAMPRDRLRSITLLLLSGASMDGKVLVTGKPGPQPIDELLRGRTMEMWRLVFHALRVNYPDFFAAGDAVVRDLVSRLTSKTSPTSPGPTPSTDSSSPA